MKAENKIRIFGCTLILASAMYATGYVKDNEFSSYPEVATTESNFYNGEVLLPDYVHGDTLVVINAKLLNDELQYCDGSDGSYNDLLGEATVNIEDYIDYINVVKQ